MLVAGGKPVDYLQAWLRVWTGDYRKQVQLAVRAGLGFVASELQVQRSNLSVTLPVTLSRCTEHKWVNSQFCLCFVLQGERSPL